MGNEMLSSDMPGTEAFDGMSEEELGAELPLQGAPGAPKAESQQTKADGGAAVRTEAAAPTRNGGTKPAEQAAAAGQLDPKPGDTQAQTDAKIAVLEQTIQQLRRENRSTQALQSRLDRLENENKARATAATATPLSPEQQAQEAQRTEAVKFIKDLLSQEMPNLLQEKYGHIIQAIERQEAQRNQEQFKTSVEQTCKDMGIPFEEVNPIFGKLIRDDIAAAQNGDAEADARLNRILNNWDPSQLILRAIQERSKTLQATGQRVQAAQTKAANGGARVVKPGSQKPTTETKRSLADVEAMSEDERDELSEEELGALLPRQSRR